MYDGFAMEGKNAIITGGTRGIGLAIARGFLEAGAAVTICGRNPDGVEEASRELAEHADRLLATTAHVGNAEDIDALLARAEDTFGTVDVLVNNAGTNPYYGPIVESEDWAWDKTMAVNLKAPYLLSRALGPKMVEAGGGSIINISSIAGLEAAPLQGIYSVTKAALIMLTKVMAREMGAAGVRVNCICPGVVKTQLSRALWEDERVRQAFVKRKALGRIGTVDELVGAAIYFASDASSFTTGAVLQVDGGMVI